MTSRCLVFILCLGSILGGKYGVESKNGGKKTSNSFRIVCYYGNWAVYRQGLARFTPQNINPYLCTHLIYAFGGFNNNFEVKPFDKYNDIEQGNYRKFIDLKKYNSRLKTMLAIGGWNEASARFSQMVSDSVNRGRFVKSAIHFLRTYGFDGLDLDWEYPTFRDGSDLADRENYALLIQELREAFDNEKLSNGRERLLLSVAVPAGQDYIDQGFDVADIAKNVDFLNLLTYDYHTSYEPTANHHAPLNQRSDIDDDDYRANLNMDWTVRYYLQLGVPSRKINAGIPTYGRGYTLEDGVGSDLGTPVKGPGEKGPATKETGYLAYYEICKKIIDEGWTVKKPYPNDVGPYAYKDDQWVAYDDEDIVMKKAKYIKDKNLGGAMFWSLDNDDFRSQCSDHPNPLITAVRSVLLGKSSSAKKKKTSSLSKKKASDNSVLSAAATTNDDSSSEKKIVSIGRRSTTRFPSTRRKSKLAPRASKRTTPPTDEDEDVEEDDELDDFSTPPTPATPDPGPAFECKDSGFFQNPTDCKKYFWCLDSGPSNLGLVAHAFTCPSGLHFNKRTDACDYPERVICKIQAPGADKKPISTTSRPKTTTSTSKQLPTTKGSAELADLLKLIQQLGGVDGVQKFLANKGEDTTTTKTTTKPTTTTTHRPRTKLTTKRHPKTTTARTTTTTEEEEEEEEIVTTTTKRVPRTTTRPSGTSTRRSRGRLFDEEEEGETTERLTRNYITIQRTTTPEKPEGEEDEETTTVKTTTKATTTTTPSTTTVPTTTTTPSTTTVPTTTPELTTTPSTTKVSLFRSTAIRLRPPLKLKTTPDDSSNEATTSTTKKLQLRPNRRKVKTTTTTTTSTSTTTPKTKIEGEKKKIEGRRIVARKRRPQSGNRKSGKDIETTGSRVSTTIQRAPKGNIRIVEIEDTEVSDATNTFSFTTPQLLFATTKPKQEKNKNKPEDIIDDFDDDEGGSVTEVVPFYTTQFIAGKQILFPTSIHPTERFPATTPIPRIVNITRRPFTTTLASLADSIEYDDQDEAEAKELLYEEDEDEEFEEITTTTTTPRPKLTRPPVTRRPIKTTKRPTIKIIKTTTRRTTAAPKERIRLTTTQEVEEEVEENEEFDIYGDGVVSVNGHGHLECDREGIFEHPIACNKFVNCVRTMKKLKPWTYTCPPGLMYDEDVGHCNWEEQVDCGKRRK